ncbi:uncharacterized protein FJT64_020491 [Amphibalanus amphitrite]|uniref:Fragile site-associated protein C-terminal domain-containing protein n=1 Tax=Amphibalanus amphitrite TaxID=1232801 RepID=A0A6A4WSK1_AMPAM|nr:uncharacterized protein FJT64_020491 [Amphibalanus amphitrite]
MFSNRGRSVEEDTVRGHAMFSNRGRSVEEDTVEYGWLLEVQAGTVTGRLTAAQMYQTVTGLESFLQLLNDHESELPPPPATQLCHHDTDQELCEYTTPEDRCPSADDIKYKMFRFSLDALDLHLVECGTSLNLQVAPCRVSTCNLYGEHIKQGLTVLIPGVELYNFICANVPPPGAPEAPPLWVEAGAVRLGPIIVDLALSCEDKWGNLQVAQDKFLRLHDESQRRLWFLWDDSGGPSTAQAAGGSPAERCGCVGGCAFFGRNANGARFFHPSKSDEVDGMNRAEYRISDSDDDLGYGQSLLHPGRLMFDLPAGSPPAAEMPWSQPPPPPPSSRGPVGSTSASPPREFGALSPPAGVDEVDAGPRHLSDSRLALPTARAGQSTLSLQTLPSVASAPAAAGRRGSRHSLASVGAASAAAAPGGPLRAMASLGSEQSEYSELYFSADEDGLSSPLPTFQTPPSTLQRAGGAGESSGVEEADRPAARMENRPETSRQVSFDALRPPSSSSSGSNISSGSFLSAASVASGEETLLPDINTVDLVAQVDRPITDSPLLMASYIYHLDQVECHSWSRPTPRPSASDGISLRPLVRRPDGGVTFAGRLFSPAFRRVTRGFSHIRLAAAPDSPGSASPSPPSPPRSEPANDEHKLWDVWENERGELGGVVGSHGRRGASHTTLIVRLREETDLALSPILLEAATRFVQTLVPALSRMHPQTVVSRHRRSAVSSVLGANRLKRDPNVRLSLRRESSLRREPVILQQTHQQQMQAFVFVPRVNITFLQASITEETISFSALDDVRDLTCVSLAALSIERLQLQLLQQRRTQRSLHVLARNMNTSTKKQHGKKKAKDVQVTYEPSLVETVDSDSQETMISVDVGRSHLQMRRLKNDSQLLKDAVITSIPTNKGKVFFTYTNVPAPLDGDFGQPGLEPGREMTGYGEEKLGYNMMELGVEQMELKTVLKRGGGTGVSGTAAGQGTGTSAGPAGGTGRGTDDEPSRSPQPPSANSRTDESAGSEGKERTTALNVDVRAVWVNCAAPPKTAVMRKTDYTRSDWNMLSTSSPSINAWLNPANRMTGAALQMTSAHTRRQLAVMACLMTAALDHPNIHATPKSKYSCVTSVAQTLQEDPSCQLCSVLARYIQQTPLAELETELRARFLPDTTTLKQGVLVLSRQWKNVLWMPFLLGHKFKDPPAVPTFLHQPASRAPSVDGEARPDEEIDERTCLLDIPLHSSKLPRSPSPASGPTSPISPVGEPRPSLPHQPLRSGRHSVMFPLLSAHLESPVQALGRLNRGFSRQQAGESNQSLCSQQGGPGGTGGGAGTVGTASRDSLDPLQASRHGSLRQKPTDDSCEDLYSWMARQQANGGAADHRCRLPLSQIRDLAGAVVDSEHQPLLSVSSDEDAEVSSQPPPPSGLQVLEAHQIFEPLLASAVTQLIEFLAVGNAVLRFRKQHIAQYRT